MGSRHVNQEPGLVLGQQLAGVSDSHAGNSLRLIQLAARYEHMHGAEVAGGGKQR
jgi:hypothetical protein